LQTTFHTNNISTLFIKIVTKNYANPRVRKDVIDMRKRSEVKVIPLFVGFDFEINF